MHNSGHFSMLGLGDIVSSLLRTTVDGKENLYNIPLMDGDVVVIYNGIMLCVCR